MPTSAMIQEAQEEDDVETASGVGQDLSSKAVANFGGMVHGRPSLPSIQSLFGIAGTGAGSDLKGSSQLILSSMRDRFFH